jgi:hypothetical protein
MKLQLNFSLKEYIEMKLLMKAYSKVYWRKEKNNKNATGLRLHVYIPVFGKRIKIESEKPPEP